MRKIKSKKGFTLVELMIVVVIMGILVAVAVPVYGAVTKNAEKKSCYSNQEIIVKAAQQCVMDNASNALNVIFKAEPQAVDIHSQAEAEQYFTQRFLSCFNESQFPDCPIGEYYHIEIDSEGRSIVVSCGSENGDNHGNWQNN